MRITGGRYRSRTLEAPRGDATRPTSDRVREALFAILGSNGGLAGARVLDLYAGTGALAFEALSRGAAEAVLVEPARAALRVIQANARSLAVEALVKVVPTTVERAGTAVLAAGPFDLVFADPPYADITSGEAPRAIEALLRAPAGLLTAEATLVLEHGKADTPPALAGLGALDTRRYGDTCLSFYALLPPAAEAPSGGG